MTYRIKNISGVEQPRITCYNGSKPPIDRDIKPNEVVEVVAEYYKDKLTIWKVVNKPKQRYYNEWILVLGTSILSYIAGVLTRCVK